ncbi:secretory phospholipase A2 [Marchantia polymorpha subsp. ruderalis]|uniref:Phospholipase A2 domain-containing protein n=2 Tax=Marchantia polymorpha TaxID=3197 RepID=A0A176WIP1_MARPO|nr:hypothetical protein AXG93_3468s1110 [Marchantia polymorpha subsp. ruderalis]PTQ49576.1 hypothetical protein MARPO_0002s0074 [Marchantia polymorpha]BBN00307.1 hypothetical protein Mp_1g28040 [Marchantia polymorpha subsp. ruderalis]|eukprot:PTQ49576.1 hypothetical protein MARPO_0002s0074 [Marchantia polymorpha]
MKIDVLNLFPAINLPTFPSFGSQGVSQDPAGNVRTVTDVEETGCQLPPFVPYASKIPWHSGPRGLFSRMFPRYGNYCGPNWSSGREDGSLFWDKAPIDRLDHCCYRHDMGYDSYEQADLHRADLRFLGCLEKIDKQGHKAGDSPFAEAYRKMYILGLRNFLIPYRKFLLQKVDEKTRKRLTEEEIFGKDRRKNPMS